MNTNLIAKVTLAAALTVAVMPAASLQADIKFPFRAASKDMPAGQYRIFALSNMGAPVFGIHNDQNNAHVFLMTKYQQSAKGVEVRPHLLFSCRAEGCGLVEIWGGDGKGWVTAKPNYTTAEKERLVTVYLDRVAGE